MKQDYGNVVAMLPRVERVDPRGNKMRIPLRIVRAHDNKPSKRGISVF